MLRQISSGSGGGNEAGDESEEFKKKSIICRVREGWRIRCRGNIDV